MKQLPGSSWFFLLSDSMGFLNLTTKPLAGWLFLLIHAE